jgi:predicted DNA-binding transcriptional regulator YafY
VVDRDETHEYLEFEVHQRRPFVRFLLRFVPRVRIVSPGDLERSLQDLAREVLALYEDET